LGAALDGGVGVTDGLGEGVSVGSGVGVKVASSVGLDVGLEVGVGVAVGVDEGVGVLVGVGVTVEMGLGEGLYLEAIAIDPDAPAPDRPRWFDLDRLSGPAHLRNWIARVEDLDAALNPHAKAGAPLDLARGDLRWRMAVPADGVLPFDNLFPALIEWQAGGHPADRLPDAGARLERLVVVHPEAPALRAALSEFADPRVVFEPGAPTLRAEIATPHGRRVLA